MPVFMEILINDCHSSGVTSRGNQIFAYAKANARISCAVTAELISVLVFARQIVQILFFFDLKFQASSPFL